MQLSVAAVISAAGSSSRMGGVKKEYLCLPGEKSTVLGAAVSAFASSKRIGLIVIVVPPASTAQASLPPELCSDEFLSNEGQNRIHFVSGGSTRRASVHNALSFLEAHHPSFVLIHDGARPWVKLNLIEQVIDAAIRYEAVIPALPLTETPKELSGSEFARGVRFIKRHLRRAELCVAQTPQGFKFPEILRAHEKAAEREARENFEYTDDAEVWGEFIGQVAMIPGDPGNRKITYPEDLGGKSL